MDWALFFFVFCFFCEYIPGVKTKCRMFMFCCLYLIIKRFLLRGFIPQTYPTEELLSWLTVLRQNNGLHHSFFLLSPLTVETHLRVATNKLIIQSSQVWTLQPHALILHNPPIQTVGYYYNSSTVSETMGCLKSFAFFIAHRHRPNCIKMCQFYNQNNYQAFSSAPVHHWSLCEQQP